MDMQFYGADCIVLSNKQNRLIIDDTLTSMGSKSVAKDGDICLFTMTEHPTPGAKPKLTIDMPGEYEVGSISIFGIQTRAHMDESSQKMATMYKITWGDTRILVVGHAFPKLTDDQLESIGVIDVMFVPVGGNGYTLDATGALQLVKVVEPKIVIPTHYDDPGIHYEVPQAGLEDALKALGIEVRERVSKFQFKYNDTATTQLVVLETAK